ncbi:MAG: hypothetical protein IKN17_03445 [Ruminococcus sp.]|nr:hypothetical protein [Ruminococcus sp.]
MGKKLKVIAAVGVVAAGTAAIFALKKRKELEDYDYEELDDDFDDCVADADETAEAAEEGAEETLDKVEDEVEEIDE